MSSNTIYQRKNTENYLIKSKIYENNFILNAQKIHGSRYDYSLVDYKNSKTKVKIICKIHGVFLQIPNSHLSKKGCYKCRNLTISKSKTKSTESFILEAKEVHKDRYDYSEVEYKHSNKNIKIICKEHGAFYQSPNNHLRGFGCQSCSGNMRINQSNFIVKSNTIHNFRYDYSLIGDVRGNKSKINIICKKHGIFEQSINKHLVGQGCPICTKSVSKIGTSWLNSLNNLNIIHEHKLKENKQIKVDGYDPTTNTVYQFHGSFFHGEPRKFKADEINKRIGKTYGELYTKTTIKDFQLLSWGYNLKVMWEYDYKIDINSIIA